MNDSSFESDDAMVAETVPSLIRSSSSTPEAVMLPGVANRKS